MESREESSSLTTNQEALNFKLEFKPNLDSQTIINNFSGEFEDLTELPLPFEGFSVFDEPTTLFATTQSQPTSVFESTESQSSTAFPSTKSHSTNVYGSTLNQETTVFESPQSQPTVVFESTQSEPNVKVASTQSKSPTTSESTQATVNTTPFSITDSTTYYPVNPSAKPLSILSNSIIEQSSTKSEPKLDSDLVLLEPHFVKPTLASEGIELEAKIHDAYKDQKFVGETVPPTVSTIFPTTTSIPRPVIVRTRFRSTMEPTTSPRSVTSTTARSSTERTSRKFFRSRRPLNRQNFLRNKIEELEAPSTRSEESNEVPNSSTEMAITMTNGFESLRTSRKKKPSAQEDIEIFNGVSVVQIPANLKRQPESIVIEPIFEEVPNGSESLEDVSTEQSFTVVIEEESEKSNSPIRIRPTFPNRPTSRKVATVKKKRPRPLTAIRRPVIRNQQTQKETVKRLLKNLRKHRQKIKARKEILREAAPIERKEVAKERPSKTIQNSRQTDSNSFVRSTNAPDKSSLSSLPPAISINTKLTGITPIISPSPISTTTETVTEAATSPFTTPDTTASTSFKVANTTTIASTASLSTRTTATTAPSIATTSTTSKVATATANTTTATTTTVSTTTATATTTTTTATTTTTTTTATTTTTTATTTTTTTTETTTATTSASTTFITTISEGTTTTNTSTSTTAATSKADSPIPARSTTTASSTTKTSAVTSEAPTTFSTIDLEDEEVTSPWPTPSSTYFPITGDSLETETDLETIASASTFSFPNPVNDIRIDTDLQFKQSNLGGSLDDLSMESVTLEPQPLTGLPSDDSNPFSVKPRRPPLSRLEELDSIENENEEESIDLTDATLSSRERFKLQLLRNKYRRQSSHEALFSKKSFKSGSDESSGVSGPSSKHPTHNRVGLSRLNSFMQRNSKELKSLSSESITRKTSTEAPLSTTEPTMNKSSILQDKIKTHLENIEKAARRVLSQRNRRRPSFFGRHSRTTKSATSTTTPKTTTTMTTTTAASTVSIMTASEKFSPEIMDVGEIKKTMNTDKSVGVYESSTTTSKSTPEMESSTVSNNKADSSAGTLRADVNSQNLEVEAFTTEFFTHIPTEQPFFSPEVVISSHDPLALNSGDESLNEHQSLLF
ncbi:mucin-2-like [Tigriopus californicus]|uniref:mucin-2-like n=1 Tax=Tigriopus californicus TaxID=6832 RepID=UPI0027DA085D|nr:mucin-2-like [Tigriopus californicus]